ncbi:ArsR/SmtB family transcription factor [Corynebacterium uterequi]|uniref:Putative transcriptional regulator n=1 Tax=Corynebacterium uterequi TaxID=1072256 RepID=A0A0G3HBI1_9CORY|nr:metalloregulator ArsR/SmtB family transcription factor [Corynebacterium uterequi]AKK10060.1 putative transcriptional regulator [Corynebacterium uterequi]
MTESQVLDATCRSLVDEPLSTHDALALAQTFKIIGDPARLLIISEIAQAGATPPTVTQLTERLNLAQSTVSHHLKKLTSVGVVSRHRCGREVTHSLVPETFERLSALLSYSPQQ